MITRSGRTTRILWYPCFPVQQTTSTRVQLSPASSTGEFGMYLKNHPTFCFIITDVYTAVTVRSKVLRRRKDQLFLLKFQAALISDGILPLSGGSACLSCVSIYSILPVYTIATVAVRNIKKNKAAVVWSRAFDLNSKVLLKPRPIYPALRK